MLKFIMNLVTAAFLTSAAVSASAHPAEETGQRVIAVGDLHGDYDAWREIARAAGLVDQDGDWSGKNTVFVQLGDVTDRGPNSLKIIEHLRELQEEAGKDGGKVIILIGNHEAMNVTGDLRYVHAGEYAAFADRTSRAKLERIWKANEDTIIAFYRQEDPSRSVSTIKDLWFDANPPGKIEHRSAWRPGGKLGTWAASLPAVAKVGETLFVHGGLSVERALRPIDDINRDIADALAEGDAADRSAAEDPLGPLWYRGNISRPADEAERQSIADELDQLLAFHKAKRIVVGHTPSITGIVSSENGRVIRADTGISSHYGGPASYLEIDDGEVIAHQRDAEGKWSSRILQHTEQGDTP